MSEVLTDTRRNVPSILVFGGTTEGRCIVEWLSARGTCDVIVSSLTEYGGSLVDGLPHVESLTGRMLPEDMEALMRARGFSCVIDATHPYAAGVSRSIAAACEACGTKELRVLREGEPEGPWVSVASIEQAADYISKLEGPALLTTGSNGLGVFADAVCDYRERLYVRILPVSKSIAMTEELGIPASHVIAMQGPFSKNLNIALIEEFDIKALVTKASGAAGGFWEKVEAANECGIELIVISRPVDELGLSLEDALQVLADEFGI